MSVGGLEVPPRNHLRATRSLTAGRPGYTPFVLLIAALALVFLATACGGSGGSGPQGSGGTIIAAKGRDFRLYRVDPESGSSTRLLRDGSDASREGHEGEPACAPDGKRVAYVRETIGRAELRLLDLESGVDRLLRTLDIGFVSPAWTPDGERLIYTDGLDGLRSLDPDTGEVEVLSRGADEHATSSPDGTRFAFEHDRTGHGRTSIWTMDTEGKDRRQLTDPSGDDADHKPQWSPDGTLIAFERPYDVWVVDPRTGEVRKVARYAELRTWSPDGQTIVVHQLQRDMAKTGLYAVPVEATGQARFIARGFWVEACWLD